MTRTQIINHLIKHNGYKSYLEIGVDRGVNFYGVDCLYKVGVDPDTTSAATIHKTSDEFFLLNKENFDIIFIDGLHLHENCTKDISNALFRLNEGGIVVCHDMLPTTEHMQVRENHGGAWTGDVWRSFVHYREDDCLTMHTVNTDYGIGLIEFGKQEPLIIKEELTYENFVKNKQEWMNIISVEEFLNLY